MSQPLLVHLIFHPGSPNQPGSARDLATSLHDALNGDPAVPGLRIPTVFAADEGDGCPPRQHRLDESDQSVVVVLIDDAMLIEEPVPAGRQGWPAFVWDLYQQCQMANRRCIPVAVSESAFPLDARLEGVSFLRAMSQPPEQRGAWTARAIVVELCRFLQGHGRGEKVDLQLFLSHAKGDIAVPPLVVDELLAHLKQTQPVTAWVDSGKIAGGANFRTEIENGVRDSAVVVVATKSYSARPWCRREVLLAKRHKRPFIVIDALEGLDPRGFPYVGNAPVLRWSDGGAPRAIDLVLKETLRHLHIDAVLRKQARAGDIVLTSSPELTTLVRLPKGSSVLYPDPPLGDEETEELEPLGHRLETPLQRAAGNRSLKDVRLVLSISESGDVARYGLSAAHLHYALHEIARQLLVRGAVLEYGGRLGSDSFMVELFEMARAYAAVSGLPPAERLVNDVGWPLPLQTLPPAERARFQQWGTFVRIPRPPGVEALDPETFIEEPVRFSADTPARRYAWARGMTAMREAQTATARARIVLGGKVGTPASGGRPAEWYAGRIPGVVEEVLVSLKAGQPMYLLGAFGGAGRLAIDLLEGRSRPDFAWHYQKAAPHSEAMRDLYQEHGPAWEDYEQMTDLFRTRGVAEVAARNRLTIEENRELFDCRDVPRVVELMLEGLTRLISKP